MKLNIDVGYILKRVVVIVLAFVIINYIKGCEVQAANCDTASVYTNYYLSTWRTASLGSSIPAAATEFQFLVSNSNIKVNPFVFASNIVFTFNGPDYRDVGLAHAYYSSQRDDITSYCSFVDQKQFVENDGVITKTIHTLNVSCSYTGTRTNANRIELILNIDNGVSYTFYNYSSCLKLNPNDTEVIINNDNGNKLDIIDSINGIQSDISDAVSDVKDSINNAKSDIINNQNSNTSDLIDSQKVCKYVNVLKNYEPLIIPNHGYAAVFNDFGLSGSVSNSDFDNAIDSNFNIPAGTYKATYLDSSFSGYVYITKQGSDSYHSIRVYSGDVFTSDVPFNLWVFSSSHSLGGFAGSLSLSKYQCSNGNQGISDTINDSDISGAVQEVGDVVDDAENQISGDASSRLEDILLAPLDILNATLNSCEPVSFPLFGKTITIPCGTTLFWEHDFSSQASIFSNGYTGSDLNDVRDGFRLFWNMFFGGAIVFHLLTKLFHVVNEALDPATDTIYDMNSAIDTRNQGLPKSFRDTDGDNDPLPKPKVYVSALDATNVDSYLMTKGV